MAFLTKAARQLASRGNSADPCLLIGTFTYKGSGSNGLKRTYIAAIKPAYPTLLPDHNRIRGDNTWSFTTLEAGHDSNGDSPGRAGVSVNGGLIHLNLARIKLRRFQAVNEIALAGRRRGEIIRPIELDLGLAEAASQSRAGQAIDHQLPRPVTPLRSANDHEPMVYFKTSRPRLPHFPLVDLHRSGPVPGLDMAASSASRPLGRGLSSAK